MKKNGQPPEAERGADIAIFDSTRSGILTLAAEELRREDEETKRKHDAELEKPKLPPREAFIERVSKKPETISEFMVQYLAVRKDDIIKKLMGHYADGQGEGNTASETSDSVKRKEPTPEEVVAFIMNECVFPDVAGRFHIDDTSGFPLFNDFVAGYLHILAASGEITTRISQCLKLRNHRDSEWTKNRDFLAENCLSLLSEIGMRQKEGSLSELVNNSRHAVRAGVTTLDQEAWRTSEVFYQNAGIWFYDKLKNPDMPFSFPADYSVASSPYNGQLIESLIDSLIKYPEPEAIVNAEPELYDDEKTEAEVIIKEIALSDFKGLHRLLEQLEEYQKALAVHGVRGKIEEALEAHLHGDTPVTKAMERYAEAPRVHPFRESKRSMRKEAESTLRNMHEYVKKIHKMLLECIRLYKIGHLMLTNGETEKGRLLMKSAKIASDQLKKFALGVEIELGMGDYAMAEMAATLAEIERISTNKDPAGVDEVIAKLHIGSEIGKSL